MIRPLLETLASGSWRGDGWWQGWRITRITGGRNNLLYRVDGPPGDLAIKFTVRDKHDRAGREYGALTALRQSGLSSAPEPILLDRTRYDQPVVVQSWLDGVVRDTPPATDDEWEKLAQHLASVHTVRPDNTRNPLPWATIHASAAEEGRRRVREQVARIPRRAQPASLRAILQRFEASQFPEWPSAPVALCRLDNNVTNYIQRPGQWASVDWEYSGWGDPAFDVANMMTHVAYMETPACRWPWVQDTYCGLVEDETASLRIQTYCEILLVWWVARLARYRYELPRGRDQRLADWPAGWQADIEAKYDHYLGLVEAMYG
jgi:aminoglycoside phosphotransferase (APT) family kinase protein